MGEKIVPLPASKLGEYTVIQDIAEGTFGKVKMATHTVTGHKVAMKYISKAVIHREKTKTRVRREFEYMRALRHPHIIKLYEVISTPTDIIFVLEYAGGELFNYIVANGRMPESRARRFFQQIISGIEYSHRLKIVHRDLKPENVLLDDDLNVKIADFGLSNEISDGDFLSTSCGSPNYAAPEVIRGAVYAGPEIDVWSSGVILYVMLCGKLPFEDDDVQVLFSKISQGNYHMPSYLSPDARSLIHAMLAVDPVRRITIPEIVQHPFFTTDLPRYLLPLPPPPGPVLGTLSSLVTAPRLPVDFEMIEGLGRIEEDVIEELAMRMVGVTKEDIWECLRRDDGPQGNAVKVAYMLLRDKRRLGKDLATFAEQERDAQLAAMDPRNALSPTVLSPGGGGDMEDNPFENEFNNEYDEDETMEDSFEPMSASGIPDQVEMLAPLPTMEQQLHQHQQQQQMMATMNGQEATTFGVLNSSLPHAPNQVPEPHHLASYAAQRGDRDRDRERERERRREKKQHRTKWHFGIRSRSPPMEVMLEIYKTLKALGMEWKEKKNLGGLGGPAAAAAAAAAAMKGRSGWEEKTGGGGKNRSIERVKELDGYGGVDLKAASQIYFVETRARVQDVVVLMNLQLYMVDSINYLVDFHHKKTYRASTDPAAGKFDVHDNGAGMGGQSGSSSSSTMSGTSGTSEEARSMREGVGDEVVSPFVFMDVACRLILELAGGGE